MASSSAQEAAKAINLLITGGSEESDDDLEDVRELNKDEQVQKAMTQLPTVSSVDYDV